MARGDDVSIVATGKAPFEVRTEVLVLPAFEEDVRGDGGGLLREADRLLGGAVLAAARAERFEGKRGQSLSMPTLGKAKFSRLALAGLGERAAFAGRAAAEGFESLRMAVGKAARDSGKAGARSIAAVLPSEAGDEVAAAVRAAAEGALLGAYRFLRYRKEEGKRQPGISRVDVVVPRGRERGRDLKDALALGADVAGAVRWARDMVNLGPADCTPTLLADAARSLAREAGLACKVRGPKEIAALGMGMFLGVTRGSAEQPRMVTVSWTPRGADAGRKPVVLVGKAITFDSGGLSLKPTESMVTMNTDMAGAAAVLGAMRVVAKARPPFPVHAVIGACENMPGGRAYKPSDVLVAFDGQTVEVTNTDAEGRLVLGDLLAWAAKTWSPAAMVDVATLTGACMVGLGMTTAGLLGPDGPAVDAVLAAARSAGEDVWRLPLVEALKEQLESERADMRNTGERWGGAISAAHFLHAFAKETPWAHLDIAGPSHATKERGYVPKGGTGFAVRTLVELVRAWKA